MARFCEDRVYDLNTPIRLLTTREASLTACHDDMHDVQVMGEGPFGLLPHHMVVWS
jgi:hypothetical protein